MNRLSLRSIHLPQPPNWWPPAPGWWLLALLLIALIVAAVAWYQSRRRRKRLVRWLDQQLQQVPQQADGANALHRLLRESFCQLDPALVSANERYWRQALERLAAAHTIEQLLALEASRYQPRTITTSDIVAATAEARPLLMAALLHSRHSKKRLNQLAAEQATLQEEL